MTGGKELLENGNKTRRIIPYDNTHLIIFLQKTSHKKKTRNEIPIRSNTGDAGNERGPAKALGLTIAGTPVWIIPAAPGGAGSDWFGRP